MDWKEFFKPSWRKTLLFLLPMMFLAVVYVISLAINSDEWKINDSPIDYVVFHFPCFIESKLLCKNTNCCFESIENQIVSSLIFYVPWFLFSWFIVWANEKVELRGYFWRKIHEKEPPIKELKSTGLTEVQAKERLRLTQPKYIESNIQGEAFTIFGEDIKPIKKIDPPLGIL
jgi:hypothetical protein